MATITRSKTWVSNETLTASDLNAEFDNVISGANSFDQANLSKTDDYTMASLIVGTGITSTDGDSVHIHPSTAGVVTADTTGDELVIEKANDVGMSFLCPANASASIFFGDQPDNNVGSIIYDHGTDMAFTVETTEVLSLSATVATLSSQLTVGVNDTGHDVKFFGATSGAYWLWDESADGVVQIGTLTVGVDDAGHDVKFFGDAASAFMLWDTSTDDLVLGGAAQLYLYDAAGGEHISSDGTDLTINSGRNINLTCASGDVVIPANIGLTFGSGEKIEGDSTDLTVTSGGAINLTATTDVVVPANVGVTFGSGEKIEGDNTDLTVTSGGLITLTATGNTVVTNALLLSGATQANSTITVGVDDAGYDVTFFGNAASAFMLWDASTDDLVLGGAAQLYLYDAGGGEHISSDGTDLTINSGQNINLTCASGDVIIPANIGLTFGSGEKIEGDDTDLTVTSGGLITLTATGNTVVTNALLLSGATQANSTITVGVDDAGYDVKLFGAAAGAFMLWDESANLLEIRGATAAGPGHLKLTTGEATVVDGDILGRIDFQAPAETGTDAILVGASIWAEADDTFAADNNETELVFATGASETAAEKMRITSAGLVGIGKVPTEALTVTSASNATGIVIENTSQSPTLTFESQAAIPNSGARDWDIITNQDSFGDFQIRVGASQGAAPGTKVMTADSAGGVYIGETVNTNMTIGLTINQGASDDQAFALKSSDVNGGGGGAATWDGTVEDDTFFSLQKRHATHGGTKLRAYSGTGSSVGLVIQHTGGTPGTTKSTSGGAIVTVLAEEVDGAGALNASVTADGNIFAVEARIGSSNLTRFLVDEDGDMWSVTTGATFDDYDDSALLDSYDAIRSDYRKWTEQEEELLIKTGILGAPLSEGGLTCVTQLQRALVGNARQMASQMSLQQEEIESLKKEMRLLKEAE